MSADIIVPLVDELEELPELDFECPKFDPSVPLLDEVFKPDEPLDAEEPLYVAAKAAIPAGFPPDTEADVLPSSELSAT